MAGLIFNITFLPQEKTNITAPDFLDRNPHTSLKPRKKKTNMLHKTKKKMVLDKTYSCVTFTYKFIAACIIIFSKWLLLLRILHSPVVPIIIEDVWIKLYGTRHNPITGGLGYRPPRHFLSDYLFGNPDRHRYNKKRK